MITLCSHTNWTKICSEEKEKDYKKVRFSLEPAEHSPDLWPSRASANTSCLIPIGVGRGIVRTIRKTFEKICKYWFKVVTVWRLIWGNDHLYCGFGARRSHLTLHWMSAQSSVGFRWGTITGPYHANFSQVETQKFDPHWFYCLQWVCNNLFCQECISKIGFLKAHCPHYHVFMLTVNRLFLHVGGMHTAGMVMTSSNGNISRVTGYLCGEFTGPRWIPRTKASETELWCFLWSASE